LLLHYQQSMKVFVRVPSIFDLLFGRLNFALMIYAGFV